MIHAYLYLSWTELKLAFRQPIAAFFTLAFPLLLLFLFGSIFGNLPSSFLGGRGAVDILVPGYIGMIIGSTALLTLPIVLATYRERGILRRYSISPINASAVLISQALVCLVFATVGIVLLLIAARLVYNLSLPVESFALIGAYLLSYASFITIGFVLGGLLPSARSAQAVGMVLYYPMLFLSGAAFPRAMLPSSILQISNVLPLTHVTLLLDGLWSGAGWQLVSLAVLTGLLIVGGIVSVLTFREK